MTVFNPAAPATPPELGPRAFIVAVLWMHGRATKEIAAVVDWTPGQVRGFVGRHFKKAREHMSTDERALALTEMKATREDGGRLKEEHFLPIDIMGKAPPKPGPLAALKRSWVDAIVESELMADGARRADALEACMADYRDRLKTIPLDSGGFDQTTKVGRREARNFENDVVRLAKVEVKARETRKKGLATRRGRSGDNPGAIIRSSALDYLFSARILRDSNTDKIKSSEEQRRLEAGMRLRQYKEGTRLGGLGAFDYENATMGSGGGPKLTLSAYKLHCIHSLGKIGEMMSKMDFAMIEAVVDQDDFIWEKVPAGGRARARIFDGVRQLLDIIAVHERLMSRDAYAARWGETLPEIERMTRSEARSRSDYAAEVLQGARS